MQAKRWWTGIGVIFVVVFIVFLIRTIQNERAYPTPKLQQALQGEAIHFNGCDISLEACEIVEMDDMDLGADTLLEVGEGCYIMTQVSVENTSDMPSTIIPDYFILQKELWKNGADPMKSYEMNNGNSFPKVLNPGECATVRLCFPIYDFMLASGDWEHIGEWEYELVVNNYPVKQSLLCIPE